MNFFIDPFKYLFNTLSQQISDQITIIRQIAQYYNYQVRETISTNKKIDQINKKLTKAKDYHQWKQMANEYDNLPSVQQKVNKVYSPYYDYNYIQELIKCLQSARQNDQIHKIVSILRSHSYRNIGNTNCSLLYRDAYNHTKKLIEDFQNEVSKCLSTILYSSLPNNKKIQFFGEMRHAIGRSALLLSGGAILGMYHIGVVQTLIEADCMPKILAGSSAGSIIASFLATRPKQDFFDGKKFNFTAFANKKRHSLWQKLKRFGKQGYLMDIKVLKQFLRDNIGDITFQQAFDKYGWILNITVTGATQYDEDRLLNYLTAPNVLIWSASAASCAIPYIYGATDIYFKNHDGKLQKYTLMNRQFLDGSIGHDLPMNKLSIFFNVNNFIVSQTNPWVIPFMDYTEEFKTINNPILVNALIICHQIKQFVLSQVKHRAMQLSYVFPSAITKFFNIFTQSYVGNITIWPVPSLGTYLRIMQNPVSYQMIANFVQDGKGRTYPKICHIKSTLFLQKQIEKCFKNTKKTSQIFYNGKQLSEPDLEEQYQFLKPKVNRFDQNEVKKNGSRVQRNTSFLIPRITSKDQWEFQKTIKK